MNVIRSARPNLLTAATLSPPPMMVSACSFSATASATAFVPASNGRISNTPMGPFQNTVPASATAAA